MGRRKSDRLLFRVLCGLLLLNFLVGLYAVVLTKSVSRFLFLVEELDERLKPLRRQ